MHFSKNGGIISTENNVGEKATPYPFNEIPEKIREYLSLLKKYGDEIEVPAPPEFSEIALMSRQTGTEFVSLTVNGKNYIIKGDERGTTISDIRFKDLQRHKGIINCHSHPYIGDLLPSESDIQLTKMIYWQKDFYIITPDMQKATYTSNGTTNIGNLINNISQEKMAIFRKLFGGD